MQLTDTQNAVLEKLIEFCLSDDRAIILQGRAGTGKTTMLKQLVEFFQHNEILHIKPPTFIFCATTHKAVEQLRVNGLQASTVHQRFNIPVKTGRVYNLNYFSSDDIVIIDECSYLDYDTISHLFKTKARFIFVGDMNQLTPVGLNHSPIHLQDFPMVELTEVIRQQNSPDIAYICDKLASNLTTKHIIEPSKNIIYIDLDEFETKAKQILPYNGTKKVLGLRNETIKRFNNLIDPKLRVGDVLVSNCSTYSLRNNEEIIVKDISKLETLQGVKGHWITDNYRRNFFIPSQVRGFNKLTSMEYFNEQTKVADLRKPYAQTIHKSQGSTYEEVYIYLPDLKTLKSREEINRLLYVALSRATNKVYLTGEAP